MRALACVIILMLGSACSRTNEEVPPAVSPTPSTVDEKVATEAKTTDTRTGASLLEVEGITFDFPHAINYDIIDKSPSGKPRHRVLVEMRGGDFDAVMHDFTTSLVHMGYKKKKSDNSNGRISEIYAAKGRPTLYLRMQPLAIGPKLKSADAVGSIHVMWNAR